MVSMAVHRKLRKENQPGHHPFMSCLVKQLKIDMQRSAFNQIRYSQTNPLSRHLINFEGSKRYHKSNEEVKLGLSCAKLSSALAS